MLVLTRTPGQSITIGDEIEVTVLSSRSGNIRLGIAAPRSLQVTRPEAEALAKEAKQSLSKTDVSAG